MLIARATMKRTFIFKGYWKSAAIHNPPSIRKRITCAVFLVKCCRPDIMPACSAGERSAYPGTISPATRLIVWALNEEDATAVCAEKQKIKTIHRITAIHEMSRAYWVFIGLRSPFFFLYIMLFCLPLRLDRSRLEHSALKFQD